MGKYRDVYLKFGGSQIAFPVILKGKTMLPHKK